MTAAGMLARLREKHAAARARREAEAAKAEAQWKARQDSAECCGSRP